MTFSVQQECCDAAACTEIAAMHQATLPGSFLASLGQQALELLYESIAAHPGGVVLTARTDAGSRLIGFVAGVEDEASFHRWLMRRLMLRAPWRLLTALSRQTIRPRTWRKLWELAAYPRRLEKNSPTLPAAELLTLAVAADFRRQGVARALYAALEAEFHRRSVPAFRILVGGELAAAQQFYAAQGAELTTRHTLHAGRESLIYVQQITESAATASDGAASAQVRCH